MTESTTPQVTMICNARLPSEKAHPWQVVQMWEAFGALGLNPTLLYPFRFQNDLKLKNVGTDFWEYYGVIPRGRALRLPNVDLSWVLPYLPSFVNSYSLIQQSSFALSAATWLSAYAPQPMPVWSREVLVLPLLKKCHPQFPLYYEMHRFPGSQVERQMSWIKNTEGVICLTEKMRERLLAEAYPSEKILVEPDAYNTKLYDVLPQKETALRHLNLTNDKMKVLYTGHLYPWKGVDSLVEAMRDLADVECHVVGGMVEDRQALKSRHREWPENVTLHAHVPPHQIPYWMSVADVAVVPNSGESILSREYTSPLKLFEIMAAGVPLVLSDLPSLREVVTDDMAVFFEADNVQSLTMSLRKSLKMNDDEKQQHVFLCQSAVKQHHWRARAERVFNFMKERSQS